MAEDHLKKGDTGNRGHFNFALTLVKALLDIR